MSHPPDDFDLRLERREPLFRRPGADDPLEPPAEIDHLVRSRARAALHDPGRKRENRPAFFSLNQWGLPLGLAATLVLAIAVGLRIETDAPPVAVDTMTGNISAEVAAPTAADKADAPAAAAVAGTAAVPAAASAPAPAPVPAEAAVPSVARVRDEPRAAAAAPPPPPPALVSAQEFDAAAAQDQAVANTEERVRTDATAKIGQAARSAAPAAASTAGIAVEDPQRWYQRIQELRRQGRTEDAEREWRALQAQYPDFRAKPE